MFNMRNQLDKIIITAMDRFVWFVLLVVVSHLVTEFTRVTGYNRGPRQDMVTVNDSLTPPIRVQNLVMYPGREYGLYEQQNQQYYNDNNNNLYNNYAYNTSKNSNTNYNLLSNLFKQFIRNNQNGQQQSQTSNSVNSNNLLQIPSGQGETSIFNFRPFIDSIFEIPISTLRAVNNLVGRLVGSYLQPPQQQPPTKYSAYPSYQSSYSYYGMQRSASAPQPKAQFEMLNRKRSSAEAAEQTTVSFTTP